MPKVYHVPVLLPPITLFEHEPRPYLALGLDDSAPLLAAIDALNERAGAELIRLGRRDLRATSYVGVVRAGRETIQVLPKIDYATAETDAAGSATRNLLHMLAYAYGVSVRELKSADLATRAGDWFELLTRLFATNLRTLLGQGMEHGYVREEETLPFLRGRWQLAQQLARRPHAQHLFDVSYDDYNPDTPLNRVLAYVVKALRVRTLDPQNRRLLADLGEFFAPVTLLPLIAAAQLDAVQFTRLNERFLPAFNLARLFLENLSPLVRAGNTQAFAFMFDMNELFEAFVAAFMARHRWALLPASFADATLRVQSRGRTIYLAQRVPEDAPAFRLYPDLTLEVGGWPALVVDTKYKRLQADVTKAGVAEGDAYQMLAYCVRTGAATALMLYPEYAGMGPLRAEFAVRGPGSDQTNGPVARLMIGTLNLHHPLENPAPLVAELRNILTGALAPVR